jgi:hypothetical protein
MRTAQVPHGQGGLLIALRDYPRSGPQPWTHARAFSAFSALSAFSAFCTYVLSGFFFAAGNSTLFRINRYPGEFG